MNSLEGVITWNKFECHSCNKYLPRTGRMGTKVEISFVIFCIDVPYNECGVSVFHYKFQDMLLHSCIFHSKMIFLAGRFFLSRISFDNLYVMTLNYLCKAQLLTLLVRTNPRYHRKSGGNV